MDAILIFPALLNIQSSRGLLQTHLQLAVHKTLRLQTGTDVPRRLEVRSCPLLGGRWNGRVVAPRCAILVHPIGRLANMMVPSVLLGALRELKL